MPYISSLDPNRLEIEPELWLSAFYSEECRILWVLLPLNSPFRVPHEAYWHFAIQLWPTYSGVAIGEGQMTPFTQRPSQSDCPKPDQDFHHLDYSMSPWSDNNFDIGIREANYTGTSLGTLLSNSVGSHASSNTSPGSHRSALPPAQNKCPYTSNSNRHAPTPLDIPSHGSSLSPYAYSPATFESYSQGGSTPGLIPSLLTPSPLTGGTVFTPSSARQGLFSDFPSPHASSISPAPQQASGLSPILDNMAIAHQLPSPSAFVWNPSSPLQYTIQQLVGQGGSAPLLVGEDETRPPDLEALDDISLQQLPSSADAQQGERDVLGGFFSLSSSTGDTEAAPPSEYTFNVVSDASPAAPVGRAEQNAPICYSDGLIIKYPLEFQEGYATASFQIPSLRSPAGVGNQNRSYDPTQSAVGRRQVVKLAGASPKTKRATGQNRVREATHACEICGDQLTSRQNLKNHINSHYQISPHICPECLKPYRHSRSLNRHRKKEHGYLPDKRGEGS